MNERAVLDQALTEDVDKNLNEIWETCCERIDKAFVFQIFLAGGSKSSLINNLYKNGNVRDEYEILLNELQTSQTRFISRLKDHHLDNLKKIDVYLKMYLENYLESTAQIENPLPDNTVIDKLWDSLKIIDKAFLITFFLSGGGKKYITSRIYGKKYQQNEYVKFINELNQAVRRILENKLFQKHKQDIKTVILDYLEICLKMQKNKTRNVKNK